MKNKCNWFLCHHNRIKTGVTGGHPQPPIESQRLAHRAVTFEDGMG